jgi:hypothetical protein
MTGKLFKKLSVLPPLLALSISAYAFQILPKISDVDRKLTGLGNNGVINSFGQFFVGNAIPMIKNPVHESITLAALGCTVTPGSERTCITESVVLELQTLQAAAAPARPGPFAVDPAK